MSAEDEKSKKLREIQERLAEIQGKSGKSNEPEKKSMTSNAESKPAVEPNPPTPTVESTEVKKEIIEQNDEPVISRPPIQKPDTSKKKNEPHPLIKATSPTPIEKVNPEPKTSTPESAGWSQNKVTTAPREERKNTKSAKTDERGKGAKNQTSKNKASKILSFISLAITLSVAAYIVYSYVLSPTDGNEEVVVAEIPQNMDDLAEPEEVNEVMTQNPDENVTTPSEEVKADEVPVQNTAQRVNEKRIERKEKIEDKKISEPKATSAIEKTSVPGGFIISYASNSNSEAAEKNVRFLRSKGFTANYYFMKDKDANAPSLYKVYLGPYSNESEAFPDFKKIIKLNEKAFILKMN